jgi:nucleoid-associated protein YgaU
MSTQPETLAHARIIKVTEAREPIENTTIPCMFNPYEYTLTKANSFEEKASANGKNSPKAALVKAGAQTLQLSLIFDTYDSGQDVSQTTDQLWNMMRVSDDARPDKRPAGAQDKREAPLVAFQWNVFFFVAYITSMTQKFTLFTARGIPVRAKVDITFTQYADIEDRRAEIWQNPTSGGGPINRVHRVVAGDRLDLIAQTVYRDPTQWRRIARFNGIVDPLSIRPGQVLAIPFREERV